MMHAMTYLPTLVLLVFINAVKVPVIPPVDPDPAYTQVINGRAQKIVENLGITDADKALQVRNLISDQYRSLSVLHDTLDDRIQVIKTQASDNKELADQLAKALQDLTQALQDKLHVQYLLKLSALLTPQQIDQVKDGMTYGVVQITYNSYLDMLPNLTDEQKKNIMSHLLEAREIAMDAGSSKEKHWWFGKYKGRINNYLSAQGYDLKKASEQRNMRNKAASELNVSSQRYKIAVCDWMILKRQKLGAFKWTDQIGADGVEVDMGSLGERETFESKLSDPVERQKFMDEARTFNLEICSIAMSGFYAQSFAERPTVPRMVQDCINTMKLMNVKVAFLPLGVRSDLVKYQELRPAVVERLKAAGARAEEAGVVIGIETALDAAGEVKLLEEIGSPGIKIYFNFSNALQNGRDVIHELKILGKDRICQIHCTDEDGVWLQNNKRLDMPKVKQTLDDMGWKGWLVIERSRDASNARDVVWNFGANTRYMKSTFQAE